MAKSLSSLWLRSVRNLTKNQRAQRRLLKTLLPKAVRAPAARKTKSVKPKTVKPKTVKTGNTASPAFAVVPKAKARPVPAPAPKPAPALPGSWKLAYFSATGPHLASSGKRMLYWLYLPSAASAAAAPLPLVVMLHGCQQTAPDFATATRMNQLAERKGFAVLYPQQSAVRDTHRCWHWYQRTIQQGQGDVRVIADMIRQVQQRHGLNASRTYVAGLSAGAGLASILALRHPELIAAVGLHSAPVFGAADSVLSAYRVMQRGGRRGYLEAAGERGSALAIAMPPLKGLPAIIIHGDRDSVVRRVNAAQLGQQLQIVNAAVISDAAPVRRSFAARAAGRSPRHAYVTTTHGSGAAGRKPQLVQVEISALGHAWSGGDDSMSFTARAGPNASLMMWEFFARHRRGTVT